ncbi:hypothetical protein ETB97_002456 [Aspergillus alliaceus]|uniref:Uncharacterized protein n=1 Tax=Petromyces alliaceus TaxID=209559 RepID=A0A8H6A2F4_PETAA|nr:hypothetical protein ETB97_002456 [Aspergillus burnettii]
MHSQPDLRRNSSVSKDVPQQRQESHVFTPQDTLRILQVLHGNEDALPESSRNQVHDSCALVEEHDYFGSARDDHVIGFLSFIATCPRIDNLGLAWEQYRSSEFWAGA